MSPAKVTQVPSVQLGGRKQLWDSLESSPILWTLPLPGQREGYHLDNKAGWGKAHRSSGVSWGWWLCYSGWQLSASDQVPAWCLENSSALVRLEDRKLFQVLFWTSNVFFQGHFRITTVCSAFGSNWGELNYSTVIVYNPGTLAVPWWAFVSKNCGVPAGPDYKAVILKLGSFCADNCEWTMCCSRRKWKRRRSKRRQTAKVNKFPKMLNSNVISQAGDMIPTSQL